MNKFIMLCGIPGSGKSTYVKGLKEEYVNLSSDDIREELYGDASDQGKPAEVFEILHQRMLENLKEGNNVVYDATNVSRKRRKHILGLIKKIKCDKEIVYFDTSPRLSEKLDLRRDRQVGRHVIDRMYKTMQIPQKHEGWDTITIVTLENTPIDITYNVDNLSFEDFVNLTKELDIDELVFERPQNNPYHSLSIDRHIYKTYQYIQQNYTGSLKEELLWAALLHDVGKEYCRQTKDNLYDSFIGHENVSAQIALNILLRAGMDQDKVMLIVDIIQNHMLYLDDNKLTKDRKSKDADILKIKLLEFFRQADMSAH